MKERKAEQDRSDFTLLLEGCVNKATSSRGGGLLNKSKPHKAPHHPI